MNHLAIYTQIAIIAASSPTETIGEVFPIMQQDAKNYVPLNVPTYIIEKPKPIVKKKLTFWQKILKLFNFK